MTQSAAEAQAASEEEQQRAQRKQARAKRATFIINLFSVLTALAVVGIGVFSTWQLKSAAPAAELQPFTRVGGTTSIETSVDAARFWLNPPKTVVEVRISAHPPVMLAAARCAVRMGAPLLVTAPGHVSPPVSATTDYWNLSPKKILRFWGRKLPSCAATGATAKPSFDVLDVPSQRPLIRLFPSVPPRRQLASFVVFAAAITPGHLPDVAVGLALAAHIALRQHKQVSLVVLQPYLEADPALERQLHKRSEQVTSGVVLGETPTIPQDTVVLLRRLLKAPVHPSLLSQIETNLQDLGAGLAALLGLVGAAAVAQIAKLVFIDRRQVDVIRTSVIQTNVVNTKVINNTGGPEPPPPPPPGPSGLSLRGIWEFVMRIFRGKRPPPTPLGADWRKAFGPETLSVTCWLRSGLAVTGTFDNKNTPDGATPWTIKEAEVLPASCVAGPILSSVSTKHEYVLVPVEDIVLVGVNELSRQSVTTPGQGATVSQDDTQVQDAPSGPEAKPPQDPSPPPTAASKPNSMHF